MSSDVHYDLIMFLSSCDPFQYIGAAFIHHAGDHHPRSMVAALFGNSGGLMPRMTVVCMPEAEHYQVARVPSLFPTQFPLLHIDRGRERVGRDMIILNKIRWLVLAIFHKLIRKIKRI